MEHYRLFIDLPLEESTSRELLKHFRSLDLPWDKIKISSVSQIHLTLKFLGDTPLDNLEKIIQVLGTVKISTTEINLELDQTKIFTPTTPRALVIGFKANKDLQSLYDQIEDSLWRANLAHKEVRRFVPHLTMARVKQSAQPEEFQKFLDWQPRALVINPAYFELQSSQLSKTGPIYSVLQTFDL